MVDTVRVAVGNRRIELIQGDITEQETDAIVNAANSALRGGGGVDGAIHRAGGPTILAECRIHGGCPTGDARVTGAGRLKAKRVIHAVGPVYRDGRSGEPALLASAYRSSLDLALREGLTSLSFPSISTGAYGYPLREAARIALRTVLEFMRGHSEIEIVRFVLFAAAAFEAYRDALNDLELRADRS